MGNASGYYRQQEKNRVEYENILFRKRILKFIVIKFIVMIQLLI